MSPVLRVLSGFFLSIGSFLQTYTHTVITLIFRNKEVLSSPFSHCPIFSFSSVQSLSHVRLCDPMNCGMPGLPVQHQLPEFTQTYVHRVSDAIQSSHPLWSPSPAAPNPSQHLSFPMSQLFA